MIYEIYATEVKGVYKLYKDTEKVYQGSLADCHAWIEIDKADDITFFY